MFCWLTRVAARHAQTCWLRYEHRPVCSWQTNAHVQTGIIRISALFDSLGLGLLLPTLHPPNCIRMTCLPYAAFDFLPPEHEKGSLLLLFLFNLCWMLPQIRAEMLFCADLCLVFRTRGGRFSHGSVPGRSQTSVAWKESCHTAMLSLCPSSFCFKWNHFLSDVFSL